MRWWPVVVLLAGCGDNYGEAPATLVRVTTSRCDTCWVNSYLFDTCGNYIPPLDMAGNAIEITSDYPSTEITGMVQVHYSTVEDPDGIGSDLDFVLLDRGTADVPAIFGTFDPSIDVSSDPPLYRVQPDGEVIDVDPTRLTGAEDTALHFQYSVGGGTVTEDHLFDKPRQLTIDATTGGVCCSAGRPSELGLVLAVLLIRPRRRRKLRA